MSGRSPAAILAELEPLGMRLELGTFRRLLAALGEPGRDLPVALVGGTNGKGSIAAVLASIATRAGLRSGLYTSPHLERWEERIRVDDEEIASPALAAHLEQILAAASGAGLPPPTPFEAMTASALVEFAAREVDLAVLEVGLGGRLDATNATRPRLSIVSRIALDHREQLGDSLAEIAREKAGILRAGAAALVAPQQDEARAALAAEALRIGARLELVAESAAWIEREERGTQGWVATLRTPGGVHRLEIPLVGEHQLDNVATAVRAAELVAPVLPGLDAAAIAAGVAATRWPGRLESLPLPGGGHLLLDAAHNPDGAAALARFLARLGRRHLLLFGALADKDAAGMLAALAPAAEAVFLTRPGSPRALDPVRLDARAAGARESVVALDPAAALEAAAAEARRRGVDLVVACGSIVLAGEIRRLARERRFAAG